jgi:hypothetical protein
LKVVLEPLELSLSPRRLLQGPFGVEHDDVRGAPVEAVVTLGMIRERRRRAVLGENEQIKIRAAVTGRAARVVIAEGREERLSPQPVAVDVEEPRVVRRVGRVARRIRRAVDEIAGMQREVERLGVHPRGKLPLRG